MTHHHLRNSLLLVPLLGTAVALHAAAPSVSLLKAEQVLVGESMALHAEVADGDGNLQALSFYASGDGISGEQLLGTHTVSGGYAVVDRAWTPSQAGSFTIRVVVSDTLAGSVSASRTTRAFAERRTVQGVDLPGGAFEVFTAAGEIRTKENTSATEVRVQDGATLILWAQNRVVLKPGFRAGTGATLWVATDADLDGYSDREEGTDTDGDGMCDAWERDHGLNPLVNDAALDPDNDGSSNLSEYLAGRDPLDRIDGASLPSGYQLVLRLPGNGYVGLRTSDWSLTTVANP